MRGSALLTTILFAVGSVPLVAVADDDDETVEPAEDGPENVAPPGDDEQPDADSDDDEEPRAKKKKAKKKKAKKQKKAPAVEAASTEVASEEREQPVEGDPKPPRITFTADLLGATPVDSGNGDLYGLGGGLSVGAEVYVAPLLGIHVAASALFLRKDSNMSSTSWLGGQVGPRVHLGEMLFGALTHHDAWIDAHFSYGTSGGIRRPGFDAGIGVLWEVSPAIRLGPTARYQFGSDPLEKHAQLFTIGVTAGFGGRTRTAIAYVAPDSDEDGVIDGDDACVDVPAGKNPSAKQPGCPDRDGDGVIDAEDQCTREAAGETPDPELLGCPLRDEDADGIGDDQDKCPSLAGVRNTNDPSQHGCPKLAKVVEGRIEILQQVFFELDSATIKDESVPVLQAIKEAIESLDGKRIRIEGHTDDKGSDQYNLDLSKRRARAVAQWLITNGGIPSTQMETGGYGKSRPIVSGSTADVSQNRRVEFIILDK